MYRIVALRQVEFNLNLSWLVRVLPTVAAHDGNADHRTCRYQRILRWALLQNGSCRLLTRQRIAVLIGIRLHLPHALDAQTFGGKQGLCLVEVHSDHQRHRLILLLRA